MIGVSNSCFSKRFLFSFKNRLDDSYTLWASGPSPGAHFMSKPFVLFKEFDGVSQKQYFY